MRDLFDEFLDELRRRQAEAAAANPEGTPPAGTTPPDDPEAGTDADSGDADDADDKSDETAADSSDAGEEAAADGDDHEADQDDHDDDARERLRMPGRGAGRGFGNRPPRPRIVVGGPNDGSSAGGLARRFGIGFLALVVLVVIVLLGVGVNFLTDAIWFQSVGFQSVFWTRVSTQVGLFAGGGLLALVFLLFNVWLAARLLPPPDPDRASPFAGWFERLAGD